MGLSGLVITVYDDKDNTQTISDKSVFDGLTFETVRFPRYWYRHLRYGNVTVFTSELNPPEIGSDSAMEMGLDI